MRTSMQCSAAQVITLRCTTLLFSPVFVALFACQCAVLPLFKVLRQALPVKLSPHIHAVCKFLATLHNVATVAVKLNCQCFHLLLLCCYVYCSAMCSVVQAKPLHCTQVLFFLFFSVQVRLYVNQYSVNVHAKFVYTHCAWVVYSLELIQFLLKHFCCCAQRCKFLCKHSMLLFVCCNTCIVHKHKAQCKRFVRCFLCLCLCVACMHYMRNYSAV